MKYTKEQVKKAKEFLDELNKLHKLCIPHIAKLEDVEYAKKVVRESKK